MRDGQRPGRTHSPLAHCRGLALMDIQLNERAWIDVDRLSDRHGCPRPEARVQSLQRVEVDAASDAPYSPWAQAPPLQAGYMLSTGSEASPFRSIAPRHGFPRFC